MPVIVAKKVLCSIENTCSNAVVSEQPLESAIDGNFGLSDYQTLPRPDLVGITAFSSQASRALAEADLQGGNIRLARRSYEEYRCQVWDRLLMMIRIVSDRKS